MSESPKVGPKRTSEPAPEPPTKRDAPADPWGRGKHDQHREELAREADKTSPGDSGA